MNPMRQTSRKSCFEKSTGSARLPLLLGVAAFLALSRPGWAQPKEAANVAEAKRWMQIIAEPMRQAQRLEVRFAADVLTPEGESLPGYDGVLFTADSNAFRLEMPSGTYVSDGRTFWEYHASTKQVLIKSAAAISGKSLPARMLLDYLSATPLACDTVKVGKGAAVRIALRPNETATHLDSLQMHIGLKSRQWQSVSTLDLNGMRTTYTLKKYRSLTSLPAATFSFSPPKGVEVVDMR